MSERDSLLERSKPERETHEADQAQSLWKGKRRKFCFAENLHPGSIRDLSHSAVFVALSLGT